MPVLPPLQQPIPRRFAKLLDGGPGDYDDLLDMVGNRTFILLGEATHGTQEFYQARAQITRRLIEERGFDAVVVEGDWPDTEKINRYVLGGEDLSLDSAFDEFHRFPVWMWRNREVVEFVKWMHKHNERQASSGKVGFYGMDLYSLYRSADAVITYLQQVDPEQAAVARKLYACLDHVRDPQDYGHAAAARLRPACRDAAARLLVDLARNATRYRSGQEPSAIDDEQFLAERNAYVVLNAEHYYRAMFSAPVNTWNLRDAHMVNTILALHRHLRSVGREGRIVIWAHNSHIGDARATGMGQRGEWNVGQLLRQHVGNGRALLVGFTTYTGHVTAARDWDLPAERRWVRPAHPDSYERMFYASRMDRFFLSVNPDVAAMIDGPMLERAIGVIYHPENELASHYFPATLGLQFDAVFHMDETTAVEPLDVTRHWTRHEPPDTWPSGL